MPFQLPKQQTKFVPVAKKLITSSVKSNIPCNIIQCKVCQDLPFYKASLKPDQNIVIFDGYVLQNGSYIISLFSQFQKLIPSTILNQIEQLNKILFRQISGYTSYPNQISEATYLETYDEFQSILKVKEYYLQHIQQNFENQAKVLIITGNQSNHNLNNNIIAIDKLFEQETYDLLSQQFQLQVTNFENFKQFQQSTQSSNTSGSIYIPHLTNIQENYISTNQILQGKFKALAKGKLGQCFCDNKIVVHIPNRYCVNRAIDGDVVVIRLFKLDIQKEQINEQDVDQNQLYPLVADIYSQLDLQNKQLQGCIVGVLQRQKTKFCGTIKAEFKFECNNNKLSTIQSGQQLFTAQFKTISSNIPNFVLKSTQNLNSFSGHRIQCELVEWSENNQMGLVSFRRDFGQIGDRDVESAIIFEERNIKYYELNNQVEILKELPSQIIDDSCSKRLDLQNVTICSVDPPGCTDVDDALHCRVLNDLMFNQYWMEYLKNQQIQLKISQKLIQTINNQLNNNQLVEVGVHIADVTHYVKYNSKIDQEARSRGTSVYLTDRRIDLLPKLLTEQVCSLIQSEPRFCFSCLLLLDGDHNILTYRFAKTVIQNRANLTYKQAWELISDNQQAVEKELAKIQNINEFKPQMINSLKLLYQISKKLRQQRLDNGSLILDSMEVDFQLDDNKNPVNIQQHLKLPTMSMIEEFMLLANVQAAQFTYQCFKSSACLRRHPAPSEDLFNDLKQKLKHYNLEIDTTNSKTIKESIEKTTKYKKVLNTLITRCMQLAKYISAGQYNFQEYYHYGLALEIYTHFTSPIRRYSDQLVHRFLAAAINYHDLPGQLLANQEVGQICQQLNERKEEADRAGRDADRVFGTLFILRKQLSEIQDNIQNNIYEGELINIYKNKLTVLIRDFGLEVNCKVDENKINENKMGISINGKDINIFNKLKVRIGFDFEHPWDFKLKVDIYDENGNGFD